MMRVEAATGAETVARKERSFACTSCACAGDATLPVPMAHTGSYATTILPQSAAGTAAAMALSCRSTTSIVLPASRSAPVSPMHAIAVSPASTTALTFCATMASDSPFCRRSEWPTMA